MVFFSLKAIPARAGVETRQPQVALSVGSANTSVHRNLTKVLLSACLVLCVVPVQGKVMNRSPFCTEWSAFFKSQFKGGLPWPPWPDETSTMPSHSSIEHQPLFLVVCVHCRAMPGSSVINRDLLQKVPWETGLAGFCCSPSLMFLQCLAWYLAGVST